MWLYKIFKSFQRYMVRELDDLWKKFSLLVVRRTGLKFIAHRFGAPRNPAFPSGLFLGNEIFLAAGPFCQYFEFEVVKGRGKC